MIEKLLSREEFRESVFKRDSYKCIKCDSKPDDAHHLLDRKLFYDNGNYPSNGVSLCHSCHIKAETGEYSVEELRTAAKIKEVILPPGLSKGITYDKWGNIEGYNKKYPRTMHAQISLGTTSDDRFMPDGYVNVFSEMDLIISEKIDGQNLCFNKHGVYARSHATPTQLPWDRTMIQLWHQIKFDLGENFELFGESMYAVHSIEYKNLENHFYLFGVRENGLWLSWEEVKFWATAFDFPTVPEIKFQFPLKNFINSKDENKDLYEWITVNLGMRWEEYVETRGALGGFDPFTGKECCEGFVIRDANSFKYNTGRINVPKEFTDSIIKIVRGRHVKTNEHWTKNWRRAKLKHEREHE